MFLGGNDTTITRYPVSFFGTKLEDGYVVSVIGGHRTTDELYRHRSFWIDPPYRGGKLAQALLQRLEAQAKSEGCQAMWGYPRPSIMPAYRRFGLRQVSKWLPDGENGVPNCYAIKYFDEHRSTRAAALADEQPCNTKLFSASILGSQHAQSQ